MERGGLAPLCSVRSTVPFDERVHAPRAVKAAPG